MERTTVYLPLELKVSIKALAKRKGSSEAEVIRNALTHYVSEEDREGLWPKSIGMISDGEVQADRFDEWLAENWKLD